MNIIKRVLSVLLAALLLAACGQNGAPDGGGDPVADEAAYTDQVEMDETEIEDEAVALASAPAAAIPNVLTPTHPGKQTKKNNRAVVDYSNTKDGYVMVNFTDTTKTRLKVIVTGPTTAYTYDLPAKKWTTFPLSDGNGKYTVRVYENIKGTSYATVLSSSFTVKLSDEFAPFIRPNQYVNYENAKNTIAKAKELAGKKTDPMDKVKVIYDYVVKNLKYDTAKAKTVKSGYLPDLDATLKSKKGICFDYAALMTGMLRSQGVPCKLVVGYAGSAYHAWISVWSEKSGWVNGAIYFNGKTWQRMDPTFASTGKSSSSIMKYIGDGKNYSERYLY